MYFFIENLSDHKFKVATFSENENLTAQDNKFFRSFLFRTIRSFISILFILFSLFLVKAISPTIFLFFNKTAIKELLYGFW